MLWWTLVATCSSERGSLPGSPRCVVVVGRSVHNSSCACSDAALHSAVLSWEFEAMVQEACGCTGQQTFTPFHPQGLHSDGVLAP